MNSEYNDSSDRKDNVSQNVAVPDVLPILPADGMVIFPFVKARIVIPSQHKLLIQDAIKANRYIGVVANSAYGTDQSQGRKTIEIGTMIQVGDLSSMPDGNNLISVKGLRRIRLLEPLGSEPYITARVEAADETIANEIEAEALRRRLMRVALEMVELSPDIPEEVGDAIRQMASPFRLAYLLAGNLPMNIGQRLDILRHDHVESKMQALIDVLRKELEILKVTKSIDEKVSEGMSTQQREYHLRQQLAAIRKELGEDEDPPSETDDYRSRIESSAMSAEARKEAERELKRLSTISPQSAEYPVIQNYLDWLLDLPWQAPDEDDVDITEARGALDRDHFGVDTVKDRIIEYLAVNQLQQERRKEIDATAAASSGRGVIMCLVGPPGTGKTSMGKSIAKAMGREFTRMSLGGIRDESEIRGHRRTYVGALPGRIIQAMKRAGSRNPVFMLDEIDKIGQDWRGDPSSALLEVLDPEQNSTFRDHFLDVDFDLSDVMFIATANRLDTIPNALRDRMDVIPLDGYTEYEKFQIAKNHLIPRQMAAHGLLENEVTFMDESIHKLIQDYTRESGVRSLERQISAICRKSIVALKENGWHSIAVTAEQVKIFLKKELYRHDRAEENTAPGVATGLAVTPAGGEILYIEAGRMPGRGRLMLTGQLGDVMKESAHIAHSFVRTRAQELGIDAELFDESDVHIHIPAGALPKDGPSAGVVLTLALASAFGGQPIPGHIGATGEITLRGRVLPVGGVKMKVLAAHRAGLTHIILPKDNRHDFEEVPQEIVDNLQVHWVETMDDVLSKVFGDAAKSSANAKPAEKCQGAECGLTTVSAAQRREI